MNKVTLSVAALAAIGGTVQAQAAELSGDDLKTANENHYANLSTRVAEAITLVENKCPDVKDKHLNDLSTILNDAKVTLEANKVEIDEVKLTELINIIVANASKEQAMYTNTKVVDKAYTDLETTLENEKVKTKSYNLAGPSRLEKLEAISLTEISNSITAAKDNESILNDEVKEGILKSIADKKAAIEAINADIASADNKRTQNNTDYDAIKYAVATAKERYQKEVQTVINNLPGEPAVYGDWQKEALKKLSDAYNKVLEADKANEDAHAEAHAEDATNNATGKKAGNQALLDEANAQFADAEGNGGIYNNEYKEKKENQEAWNTAAVEGKNGLSTDLNNLKADLGNSKVSVFNTQLEEIGNKITTLGTDIQTQYAAHTLSDGMFNARITEINGEIGKVRTDAASYIQNYSDYSAMKNEAGVEQSDYKTKKDAASKSVEVEVAEGEKLTYVADEHMSKLNADIEAALKTLQTKIGAEYTESENASTNYKNGEYSKDKTAATTLIRNYGTYTTSAQAKFTKAATTIKDAKAQLKALKEKVGDKTNVTIDGTVTGKTYGERITQLEGEITAIKNAINDANAKEGEEHMTAMAVAAAKTYEDVTVITNNFDTNKSEFDNNVKINAANKVVAQADELVKKYTTDLDNASNNLVDGNHHKGTVEDEINQLKKEVEKAKGKIPAGWDSLSDEEKLEKSADIIAELSEVNNTLEGLKVKINNVKVKAERAKKNYDNYLTLADKTSTDGTKSDVTNKIAEVTTVVNRYAAYSTHWSIVIAGYTTQLANYATAVENDYKAATMNLADEAKVAEYNNNLGTLLTNVDQVKTDAANNEAANTTLDHSLKALQNTWQEVYDYITTTDKSSSIDTWLDQMAVQQNAVTDIVTRVKTNYEAGMAYTNQNDLSTQINSISTAISNIKNAHTDQYSAAVKKDNEDQHLNLFLEGAYKDAEKAYTEAISKLNQYASIKNEAIETALAGLATTHADIYAYAEKLRTLKSEEGTAYTAYDKEGNTEIYSANSFINTANTYTSEINSKLATYVNKVNKAAMTAYEDVIKTANNEIAVAMGSVASYLKSSLPESLTKMKDDIQAAAAGVTADAEGNPTDKDFALNLDKWTASIDNVTEALPKALAEAAQNEYNARLQAANNQYTTDFAEIAALLGGINTAKYQSLLNTKKTETIDAAKIAFEALEEVSVSNVNGILSTIASFYDGTTGHSKAYNDAKAESEGNVKNNTAWDNVQNTYVPKAIEAADALKDSALQLYTMHKENSAAASAVEGIYTVIANIKAEAETAWSDGTCDDNENTYKDALDPNKADGKLAIAIASVKSTIISLEKSDVSVLISALKEQYNNAIAAGKTLEYMAEYEKTIKGYEEELAAMDFSKLTYDQAHAGLLSLEGKIAATHKQLSDLSDKEAYNAAVAEIDATIGQTETQLAEVASMVGEFEKLTTEFGVELENLQASLNAFKADYDAKKEAGTVLFYKNNLLNDIKQFQPQIEEFATGALKTRYDVLVENRGANDVISKNLASYWAKYMANKAIADTYTHEGYVYDTSAGVPELVEYRAKTEREIVTLYNSQVDEVETKYENETLKYSDIQTYSSLDSKIEEYLKYATYYEAQGRINDTGVNLEGLTFSLKDYGTQTYKNLMEQKNSISEALTIVAKYNDDAFEDNTIMTDIDGNDVSFTPDWAEEPQGIRCDYMTEAWLAIQDKLTELSGKINDFKIALEDEKVVLGDATGDKKVRVTDYEEVRRWILGAKEFEEIDEKLAYGGDVNSDKKFDVADLTCISGLIFEDGFQIPNAARVSARMRAAADATDQLTLTSESEETSIFGKTVRMALNVENAETFTAGQLDITLPQGMKIAAQSLSDRANGHELLAGDLGNGTVRMVASTVENNAFTGHNGALIYLDVEVGSDYKGGQISIDNVIFTDAKANSYYLSKNAPILPTGVEGIQAATMKERIYSVGGQMLKAVKKGVNIIKGENGTKKVISNK